MAKPLTQKQRDALAGHHYITSENARELQKMGLEKRKQNQAMRETLQATLDMLLKKSIKEGAQIDPEGILSLAETAKLNISAQQALALAMIQKALAGDVDAAKFVRDTLGEKPVERVENQISIEDYVKEHKVKF